MPHLVVVSGSDFEPRDLKRGSNSVLKGLNMLGDFRFEYRAAQAAYAPPAPIAVVISEQNPNENQTRTHEPRGEVPRPTLYMFHGYAGPSTGGQAWYADEYVRGEQTRVLARTLEASVASRLSVIGAFLAKIASEKNAEILAQEVAMASMDGSSGHQRPVPPQGHIFVSYLRSDAIRVDQLVSALRAEGYRVWLDRNDLEGGTRWRQEIAYAIRSGVAMVACFSSSYAERDKSYMNEELTVAIEEIRARPTDRAWFFPVRLDECTIPDRAIGAGESLRDIQVLDLFPDGPDVCKPLIKALACTHLKQA